MVTELKGAPAVAMSLQERSGQTCGSDCAVACSTFRAHLCLSIPVLTVPVHVRVESKDSRHLSGLCLKIGALHFYLV
jgi:hypothetical protein